MKKIFTLNLDGLTMIPSEEAAKMIGGKGNNNGGASLWTPNIPIITIDFNSGTTGCLNGLTGSGKKDKNGNVTLNTNYAIGKMCIRDRYLPLFDCYLVQMENYIL